jgi:hypothetical protein
MTATPPSLSRARRRRAGGRRRDAAVAAGLLLVVAAAVVALCAAAADDTPPSPSSCGHSLPAVRAMTRAAASRLRIQQAREAGERGGHAAAVDEGARRAALRAALAAAPRGGAPLRVAVLSRLSSSSSSSSSPAESDALDAVAEGSPEARAAALDYAERVLLPGALAALATHLRVRLPAPEGRPLVPRDGPGSLPAAAACGAARGAGAEVLARKDLASGGADLALFVTAATGGGGEGPSSLCPPGAVAWAVACARDAALTGRPTAAAINLCPRVLQQGPEGLPAERAVAAVVHELVHVLVSEKVKREEGRGGGRGTKSAVALPFFFFFPRRDADADACPPPPPAPATPPSKPRRSPSHRASKTSCSTATTRPRRASRTPARARRRRRRQQRRRRPP